MNLSESENQYPVISELPIGADYNAERVERMSVQLSFAAKLVTELTKDFSVVDRCSEVRTSTIFLEKCAKDLSKAARPVRAAYWKHLIHTKDRSTSKKLATEEKDSIEKFKDALANVMNVNDAIFESQRTLMVLLGIVDRYQFHSSANCDWVVLKTLGIILEGAITDTDHLKGHYGVLLEEMNDLLKTNPSLRH